MVMGGRERQGETGCVGFDGVNTLCEVESQLLGSQPCSEIGSAILGSSHGFRWTAQNWFGAVVWECQGGEMGIDIDDDDGCVPADGPREMDLRLI